MVKLNINGKEITASPDKTILQVCREQNLDNIPTLCYDDKLPPFGSCFLCVVEMEGQSRLFPSCATKVTEGMKIQTRSEKVKAARKTCLELLVSDHYADCFGPCRLKCPADVDIQGYMSLINLGKPHEAIALIKEKLPFPSVCGRVCTRNCEVGCRRNISDAPVGIDYLKRYAADQDMMGEMWQPETKPDNGHQVAIIGGGPAGLTAAYYLVIDGYRPTIFESLPELGGMLKYGIPEYRLPKKILDKEINWITDLGVEVKTNSTLGKDFQMDDLFEQGFEAVFVGLGAQVGKPMQVENEDVDGVLSGVEFLRQVQLGTAPDIKGRVVVVGGGNTAMDAARTVVRLGADEVILLYRRTRKEMPANIIEIDAADEEGIKMEFLAAPVLVNTDENGRFKSIDCIRMELGEPDDSGRRRPIKIKDSEYTIECDWVISAIGQEPDLDGVEQDKNIGVTRWNTIEANEKTFLTDRPGVFSGGDVVTGPADAVDAIAAGRVAARAIGRYIRTGVVESLNPRFESKRDAFKEITAADLPEHEKKPRLTMPELAAADRINTFEEVECGFTEEMAKSESMRCVECGCDAGLDCLLQDYCTEYGVDQDRFIGEYNHYEVDTRHPFIKIDSNKCILCGRCVAVCSDILNISALGFVNRGFKTIVKPSMEKALQDTPCVSCGNCIDVCPTGTLVERMPFRRSGPWKMEQMHSVCNYCSVGCNITINAKTPDLFFVTGAPADSGPNDGELCIRGRFGYQHYLDGSRITKPMVRKDGKLVEVAWDVALEAAINGLKKVSKNHSPDHLMVAASPKLSNEELYLAGRMGRAAFGTNNILSFQQAGNAADYHALDEMLGATTASVTEADIDNADLYLFVGGNPTIENPVLGWQMKRRMKHGTEAIVVNSAKIDLVDYATVWADPRRGDATSLLKGVIGEMIRDGKCDEKFISERTADFDKVKAEVSKHSVDDYATASGVSAETIKQIARMVSDPDTKVVAFYNIDSRIDRASGDLQALATLLMISGKIGVDGSGLALTSSQCNSSGLRLAGFDSQLLPGGATLDNRKLLGEAGSLWQTDLKSIIEKSGTKVSQKILEDRIRGAFIVGENPAVDPTYDDFLKNIEFLVVVDMFYHETAQGADVVLPLSGYLENEGHLTNWSGVMQKTVPIGEPLTGMSNIDLFKRIMEGFGHVIGPKVFDELKGELSFVIDEANAKLNGQFATSDGKAHFVLLSDKIEVTSATTPEVLEIDARMDRQMGEIKA